MERIIRVGMDTSKSVFQVHGVDVAEVPVLRRKLARKEMIRFFEKLPATLIAIEACAGSHHWGATSDSDGPRGQVDSATTGEAIVVIRDRVRLEGIVGETYGSAESQYRRLLPTAIF